MKYTFALCFLLASSGSHLAFAQKTIPYLRQQGSSTQLIVSGKPFLVWGGELGNSSASDVGYMRPVWNKLKLMNCNTVLVPVYWELMEPQKGHFDFSLIDNLIDEARNHNLKIVFLWFGSWKNSMSCYVPQWVKQEYKTYPRARDKDGVPQEILTPFSENNLQADKNAYREFMKHLKQKDEIQQTIIMVQVENEVGMLPSAKDYHPDAIKAFNQDVPATLIQYLQQHKSSLAPSLLELWKKEGFKTRGTWEQVFGKGLATDELFIAWYLADFTNKVTAEGKKAYPLPMFVNAALNRPNVKPGDYPSGGPLPHLIDIWKAAAPAIDFLSPDFYNPNFRHWNDLYKRSDNPLFIPEIKFDPSVAAKVFYAAGHYHAIGFSPFSIESANNTDAEPLKDSYSVLTQISSLISEHQGKNSLDGSLVDKVNLSDTLTFGNYTFVIKHDYTLGWSPKAKDEQWPEAAALIIQTSPDEFIVAGTSVVISFFTSGKQRAGILSIEEGNYVGGQWTRGRILNGDQSHQGRHLRIEAGKTGIQKLKLYQYE